MTARKPPRPARLAEVAAGGDTLATLESMRDQIARDLDGCESMRDKAALYLRLADVVKTIQEIRPAGVEGDSVDEIAARRAARRSGAAPRASRTKRPV